MTTLKPYPLAPSPGRFDEALDSGKAEALHHKGTPYVRVREDYRGMPRGVAMVSRRVVPGYPRIGRLFALDSGIRGTFDATFYAEEKIDGYNIRIFCSNDTLFTLTRSGRQCPFTYDRLPDLVDRDALLQLFRDHPDLILCAEVAGPGNPYMAGDPGRYGDDVALFAFDLMRFDEQTFIPLVERRALLSGYGIPQSPFLGRLNPGDTEALKDIIRGLDREGAEGVVLKPGGAGLRVKYVTPSINLVDVAADAALELELPGEFYVHRVVRLVMALRELGLTDRRDELAGALGRSLAAGFDEAISGVTATGEVAREFRVRLREAGSVDALLEHLGSDSRTVRIREVERRFDGTHHELTFRKIFRKSTSKLQTLLGGTPVFD